jgi:multidrug resistance efflux pump
MFLSEDYQQKMKECGLSSSDHLISPGNYNYVKRWLGGLLLVIIVILFLPWTQNIRAKGKVTGLYPEERPQQLNSIIAGRVERWYVKEGDIVKKGDTIIQLSEVKESYLDPELVNRTAEQLLAKEQAIIEYRNKVGQTKAQINAQEEALRFKLQELRNKIGQQQMKIFGDSMELVAAVNDWKIKEQQWIRQQVMFDSGLVSLTQLETRNQAFQAAIAKKSAAEMYLNNSRQEFARLLIEMNTTTQDYTDKISKTKGDQFQAQSEIAAGEGDIAKLQNTLSNYRIRSGMYYVLAPQDGQIIQAQKAGIGEIVKDGDMIVEMVPQKIHRAVELFVKPMDVPLVSKGQKVRFMFDGFPAIVFSGWPQASLGLFGGRVTAVEQFTNGSGLYRVLIEEDPNDKPWPPTLNLGTGAQAIALLKDVPVWYELWRNINGFPPDYYNASLNYKEESGAGLKVKVK